MWLQLLRASAGALAVLFLGTGLSLSTGGASHEFFTYLTFYGVGLLFAFAVFLLTLTIHSRREADPETRPLNWGDLVRMRVPIESSEAESIKQVARRGARHGEETAREMKKPAVNDYDRPTRLAEVLLRPLSPPPGSNRNSLDYKSSALPIKLGGQCVVARPTHALPLIIAWGINAQPHSPCRNLFGRDDVDAIRLGAVDDE